MPTATVTRFRGISFLTAGYSVMNLIPLRLVCSESQPAICEGRTLIVLIKTSLKPDCRENPAAL